MLHLHHVDWLLHWMDLNAGRRRLHRIRHIWSNRLPLRPRRLRLDHRRIILLVGDLLHVDRLHVAFHHWHLLWHHLLVHWLLRVLHLLVHWHLWLCGVGWHLFDVVLLLLLLIEGGSSLHVVVVFHIR